MKIVMGNMSAEVDNDYTNYERSIGKGVDDNGRVW